MDPDDVDCGLVCDVRTNTMKSTTDTQSTTTYTGE